MWRRFFGGVFVLATTACQSNVRFIEAPPLDGMASAVFVRFVEGTAAAATLTATDPLLVQQPADGNDRLVLAAWERPVEAFAWDPGKLPVLDSAEGAAFLPEADTQWVFESGTWEPLAGNALDAVPLRRPTAARCLLSGGCYQGLGESERGECTVCEPEPPAPTVMPEPVQWATWSSCPNGASLVADSDLGLEVCEIPDRVACAQYERQPMLSSVCEVVAACPVGLFAERRTDEPSRLFVDPEAPAGGDGLSETSAFNSLSEAATSAAPDTVIYLASGTYDVPPFTTRLNLKGVCPERVTLRGFTVRSATVALQRVSIAGDVDAGAGGHLDTYESLIDGLLIVDAATAHLDRSVVLGSVELRGTAYARLEQSNLHGFLSSGPNSEIVATDFSSEGPINTEGSIDLRRSRVDGAGSSVMAGGPVVLEDVWWQDSQDCDKASLLVQQAAASLTRVSLNRSGAGPLLFDRADATLDEVVFRDSVDCPRALTSSASDVVVRRFAAARVVGQTILVRGASRVTMQDALLSKGNTGGDPVETIQIRSPSAMRLERALMRDHQHIGLTASGELASAELYDVEVSELRSVLGLSSRIFEVGLGTLTGARIRATDAGEVMVASVGSTVRFEDFSTARVVNPVRVRDRSDVTITRAQFDETFGVGACAQFGATADLTDVVVTGVRAEGGRELPNCPNGVVAGGAAFSASVDAALFVTRLTVTDAETAAFLSFKPGTILAREGLIQQTKVAVLGDQETELSEFLIRMRYDNVEQPLLLR